MFKKAAEKAKKGLKSLDTALGAKPDPVWPDRPSESKFPGQVFQVLAAGGLLTVSVTENRNVQAS